MRRIIVVTLASCVIALLGGPLSLAQAADYDGGHYRHRHAWNGGDCCDRPAVRYEPRVRYLRLVEQLPYCAYCDNPPTRYVADPYWPPACHSRQVPVSDGHGGWLWGVRTTCY